jgi:hypothetical protein
MGFQPVALALVFDVSFLAARDKPSRDTLFERSCIEIASSWDLQRRVDADVERRSGLTAKRSFEDRRSQAGAWERD